MKVSQLDQALWLARRQAASSGRRLWSAAEVDQLHRAVGQLTLTELAEQLDRRPSVVVQKLHALGYSVTKDMAAPLGVSLIGLARRLGAPYDAIHRHFKAGRIKAEKSDGKNNLVRWPEVRRVERWMGRIRARRERALARIHEPTIGKQAAMAMLHIGETHIWRYLVGGVLKGWKIPCQWTDYDGVGGKEWLISAADAVRVKRLRESGRLKLRRKAYRAMANKANTEIKQLRKARRLGQRDDLKHARSPIIEGCYTVTQVASRVGISTQEVYEHIRIGRLPAEHVRVGGRFYIAIRPEMLAPYLAWMKLPVSKRCGPRPGQGKGGYAQDTIQVHRAGLLTTAEAAAAYDIHVLTLRHACLVGLVPSRKIGRMLAVRRRDMRAYARAYKPRKGIL